MKGEGMKEWGVGKVAVLCVTAISVVIAVCLTVYNVTDSNNLRALEESRLEESARKAKANDDLEAARVQAAKEVREAELDSKKRKLWERSTKSDEDASR